MKTLADLADKMKKTAANLNLEVSRCTIEAARVIHHNLTEATPVDTSTALSNWDISVGTLNGERHEAWFYGKKGSTKLRSMNAANIEADVRLKTKKANQSIFISNSVDYIKNLNDGSSKQEPAGFVERAILLGRKSVQNFKMKLR